MHGSVSRTVILSITGPRETHDYRDCNLYVPGIT